MSADAERDREPDAVDAVLGRGALVARADVAGHRAGGRVGEEVEDPERGGEHDRGDRDAAERPGAEVTDDRGVGEQVQRLGDQRAERGSARRTISRSCGLRHRRVATTGALLQAVAP